MLLGVLGPPRGPKLFGWKSAKFLSELHFTHEYRPGFWESLGCHARGRWEQGERWAPEAAGVWNVLTWITSQYRFLFGYTVWVLVMQKGGMALGRAVRAFGIGKRPDPELSERETRARAQELPAEEVINDASRGWDGSGKRASSAIHG